MKDISKHIAIVGAGISGLALGIILKKNNIPCLIFEKSKKISEYGAGISLSPNGLRVLKDLDVFNNIKTKLIIFYHDIVSLPTPDEFQQILIKMVNRNCHFIDASHVIDCIHVPFPFVDGWNSTE